ncbi:hypothetical protein ACVBEF_09880 [Glaciimonas sp. GG7]
MRHPDVGRRRMVLLAPMRVFEKMGASGVIASIDFLQMNWMPLTVSVLVS